MPPRLPLGYSDYREIRKEGFSLVDKSGLIGRVLTAPAEVQIFCRPRRFGKTTNLSMLRYFLEKPPEGEDRSALFAGTEVWSNESARRHFGQYPVVYLSLKDVRGGTWKAALARIACELAEVWERAGIDLASLSRAERRAYDALFDEPLRSEMVADSLRALTHLLAGRAGKSVWVLIDEYDTPLHSAWAEGHFDEAATFFRPFFGSALKDNTSLQRAVLTGILRVARESIFSDLNHVAVDTVLDTDFATDFGFTEAEVAGLIEDDPVRLAALRMWYNGYRFGGHTIYNPWSIVSALSRPNDPLQSYWIGTGGTEILERLSVRSPPQVATAVERLLGGERVELPIHDGMSLRDLEKQTDGQLNVLLHAGYLTAVEIRGYASERVADVVLPNFEVTSAVRRHVNAWLPGLGTGNRLAALAIEAALSGDAVGLQDSLGQLVVAILSWHDLADDTPERVYHAFVLGVFSHAPAGYRVLSNREMGDGRPDVVILPSGDELPAALFEFKRAGEGELLEAAVMRAERQIVERRYREGIGASCVFAWAVAFSGKQVVVKGVG